MTTIAVMIFMVFAAIAALHLAWGFGVRWPAQDERALVALVIGQRGRTRMPGLIECLIAAAMIFAVGVVALAMAGMVPLPLPAPLVTAAGVVVAAVLAARGIAAYLPAWRDRFLQEPFATLDRGWYGPFCLLIAVAFTLMVVERMVK